MQISVAINRVLTYLVFRLLICCPKNTSLTFKNNNKQLIWSGIKSCIHPDWNLMGGKLDKHAVVPKQKNKENFQLSHGKKMTWDTETFFFKQYSFFFHGLFSGKFILDAKKVHHSTAVCLYMVQMFLKEKKKTFACSLWVLRITFCAVNDD